MIVIYKIIKGGETSIIISAEKVHSEEFEF